MPARVSGDRLSSMSFCIWAGFGGPPPGLPGHGPIWTCRRPPGPSATALINPGPPPPPPPLTIVPSLTTGPTPIRTLPRGPSCFRSFCCIFKYAACSCGDILRRGSEANDSRIRKESSSRASQKRRHLRCSREASEVKIERLSLTAATADKAKDEQQNDGADGGGNE
jgi:hypothetical protein